MSTVQYSRTLHAHALDALRRARNLPIGSSARNDLRQLAIGLRWLERKGAEDACSRVADSLQRLDRTCDRSSL